MKESFYFAHLFWKFNLILHRKQRGALCASQFENKNLHIQLITVYTTRKMADQDWSDVVIRKKRWGQKN
jgi:hypothetical protein